MKIAFDAGEVLKNNGMGVYARGLVTALALLFPEDRFCLVTNPKDAPALKSKFSSINNIIIEDKLLHPHKFGKPLKELVKIINSARWKKIAPGYDLVHQANQFRTIKGIDNLTATVHDLIPLYDDGMNSSAIKKNYRKKIGYLVKNARLLFVPTEFVKNDFAVYFPGQSPELVATYEGTDDLFTPQEATPSFREKFGLAEGAPYFLHVSRLYPRKNSVAIVKAFSKLKELHPNIALVLVINGSAKEKKDFYDSCGSSINAGGVKIFEALSLEELVMMYSNATGFLFPSFSEGFGLPMLEAMKCGCPVITSSESCLPEVAGEAALLVNPASTDEIADAMEQLITNPELRAALIEKGCKRASELTWENAALRTYDGYRRALAPKGRSND